MAKLSDLHNAIVKGSLELAVSTTQEALQENRPANIDQRLFD